MKKALMASVVAVMLLMGLATGARADYATSGTVSFYLVDLPSNSFDQEVTINATTALGDITKLKYSYDNSTWYGFTVTSVISGSATIPISPTDHAKLMYLAYDGDNKADSITFESYSGNSGSYTSPQNLDLYTGLYVNFDTGDPTKITVASNENADKFAPVPVPPSVWLMGAGLVGLVVVRKRIG